MKLEEERERQAMQAGSELSLGIGRKVILLDWGKPLSFRLGDHVEHSPPMAIWVDKAVCVHKSEILWLIVG